MDELIFYGGIVMLVYCFSAVILDLLYRCSFVYDTTYDVFMLEENKEVRKSFRDDFNYFLKFLILTPIFNTLWLICFVIGIIIYVIIELVNKSI